MKKNLTGMPNSFIIDFIKVQKTYAKNLEFSTYRNGVFFLTNDRTPSQMFANL